ncbi:unnamed protein product [Linum tenue]|uniref:Cytochrome P450 n=1 Tax=Linum tenue TaxID=586396 RepID=A0AAV0GSH4_9ROSI|nr:unnamed protein product [Linum tenue]
MDNWLSQFGDLILSTALALLFFVSISYWIQKPRKQRLTSSAPVASGAWPVIGHLPVLSGRQLPHHALGSLADKHGPIFTLRLGRRQALVISSWELAKEIFTTNDAAVSSRPPLTASKLLGYDFAMFAFTPYGPYWREMRKITVLELLSVRRLELLGHVRASELATSMKELHGKTTSSSLVDLNQWVSDLSLNVVLRMVAGKRYFGSGAMDGGEEGIATARRMQKAVRELYEYLAMFVVRDVFPSLGWADIGGYEKVMKRIAADMDGILQDLLDEHKRKRAAASGGADGSGGTDQRDFMDVLLSLLDGADEVGGYDSDAVIKSTVLAMIAAGTDTATVTVTWAISLLLNNRHVLLRAQKELDDVVSKDRISPTDDELNNLVYLKAIVKETLRLYPATPLSSPRQFTRDCHVGGYPAPEGTWLIVNLWKIHTDPEVWAPDPMEFRPERFLTAAHRDVDVRGSDFHLMPFGSGRRGCPGVNFGLQMIHQILASVLHAFDVSSKDGADVDMTESFGLTNAKATPLEVHVSPRLPADLY